MIKNLANFQKKVGINFHNQKLLTKSFTHKSYNPIDNNEKLEFLGDRVLRLLISQNLLKFFPNDKEGDLDKKLASLVNKNQCAKNATNINLQDYILIKNTQHNSNIENKASREELLAMAEISEDEGAIDEQEGDIIENLMKLDDMPVEDIMTPRSVIFALGEDDTVGIVIDTHSPIAFSRIPVFKNDLDHITGIVNRYTLVNKQAEDQFNIKIKNLMSPIHSVIEKTSVSDVLDLFVKRREQMFMVTDDFGTTTGLITLEDAIETLLGVEIVDEHDHVIDMRKLASAKLKQQKLAK